MMATVKATVRNWHTTIAGVISLVMIGLQCLQGQDCFNLTNPATLGSVSIAIGLILGKDAQTK